MYFSRLTLNPRSRQVQSELRDPYQMHKTLARGFPCLAKEEFIAARVLFRVEEANSAWHVLVQSQAAPDWTELSHIPYYLLEPPETKTRSVQVVEQQCLIFRLVANPTYRPKEGTEGNGPRRGLFREAERLDWLRRQAESHGFEMDSKPITFRQVEDRPFKFRGHEYDELTLNLPLVSIISLNDGKRFSLPHGDGRLAFSAARFDGTLRVTDTSKFIHALENGVGSGKAFGFGLLSLAKL